MSSEHSKLLNELTSVVTAGLRVHGLSNDSRTVREGDLFLAYRGLAMDGHDFAADAVRRGAVAVLAERPLDLAVPCFVDPHLARHQSAIAAAFYDDPSADLCCIGVTGTNGKTSIAYFLAAVLDSVGYSGTIGWGVLPTLCESRLTTADALTVQRQLADFRARGLAAAALEVSSHALDQARVDAVQFDAAVLSNVSRDHLDYHGSMARYIAAKRKLFERSGLGAVVVNVDDPVGESIAAASDAELVLGYGAGENADIRWRDVSHDGDGLCGIWLTPWGKTEFRLPLLGEFSLANAAAVLGVACWHGMALQDVVDRMAGLPQVPGRMQVVTSAGAGGAQGSSTNPVVIVDYAHTPDALSAVLRAARSHLNGRLICVFGCGGDRDRGKRPLMAAAVEGGADYTIVTSDNPRSEDPRAIVDDIVQGFTESAFEIVIDRREAIADALRHAQAGDIVLVAGKGHETYQEIAGVRQPFDDVREVRRALGTPV